VDALEQRLEQLEALLQNGPIDREHHGRAVAEALGSPPPSSSITASEPRFSPIRRSTDLSGAMRLHHREHGEHRALPNGRVGAPPDVVGPLEVVCIEKWPGHPTRLDPRSVSICHPKLRGPSSLLAGGGSPSTPRNCERPPPPSRTGASGPTHASPCSLCALWWTLRRSARCEIHAHLSPANARPGTRSGHGQPVPRLCSRFEGLPRGSPAGARVPIGRLSVRAVDDRV